ncbi:hypothetical protein [Okeania sp. SIO2C2]|uniref:hypothetical protein n=1 Tax=Okeania sp. SIO2C2 TaxID=2607787 RepID=UPI00257C17D7|nr:hypothetical protein [Okeania sp. SIO2C2]
MSRSIAQCFLKLKQGTDTWVLDADIKGFFDNVSHETIPNLVGTHPARKTIKQ